MRFLLIVVTTLLLIGCGGIKYRTADVVPNKSSLQDDGYIYGIAQVNIAKEFGISVSGVQLVSLPSGDSKPELYGLHNLGEIGDGLYAYGGSVPAGKYRIRRFSIGNSISSYALTPFEYSAVIEVKQGVVNIPDTVHINILEEVVKNKGFFASRAHLSNKLFAVYRSDHYLDNPQGLVNSLGLSQYNDWVRFKLANMDVINDDLHFLGQHHSHVFNRIDDATYFSTNKGRLYKVINDQFKAVVGDSSLSISAFRKAGEHSIVVSTIAGGIYIYDLLSNEINKVGLSREFNRIHDMTYHNGDLWVMVALSSEPIKTVELFNNPSRGGHIPQEYEIYKITDVFDESTGTTGDASISQLSLPAEPEFEDIGFSNTHLYILENSRLIHSYSLASEEWQEINSPFAGVAEVKNNNFLYVYKNFAYKDRLSINTRKNMAFRLGKRWKVPDFFSLGKPAMHNETVYVAGRDAVIVNEQRDISVPGNDRNLYRYQDNALQIIAELPEDCETADAVILDQEPAIDCHLNNLIYKYDTKGEKWELIYSPLSAHSIMDDLEKSI